MDQNTNPIAGDLAAATTLAAQLIGMLGAGDSLLSLEAADMPFQGNLVSKVMADPAYRAEADRVLNSAADQVACMMMEHRGALIAIADGLCEQDELSGDEVRFDDIVQPLVRVVAETVTGPDRDLRLTVEGNAGMLPGDLATPLAVVLNELMQNAVDHAFPHDDDEQIAKHEVHRGEFQPAPERCRSLGSIMRRGPRRIKDDRDTRKVGFGCGWGRWPAPGRRTTYRRARWFSATLPPRVSRRRVSRRVASSTWPRPRHLRRPDHQAPGQGAGRHQQPARRRLNGGVSRTVRRRSRLRLFSALKLANSAES
mgnify:CR=1 FL=1